MHTYQKFEILVPAIEVDGEEVVGGDARRGQQDCGLVVSTAAAGLLPVRSLAEFSTSVLAISESKY